MSLADALEQACTYLDDHVPPWPWLMGWLRCPNGWLARLAFRLDGRGER